MWAGGSLAGDAASAAAAGPKEKMDSPTGEVGQGDADRLDRLDRGDAGRDDRDGVPVATDRQRAAAKSRLEAYRAKKAGGTGVVSGAAIEPTADWQFAPASKGTVAMEGLPGLRGLASTVAGRFRGGNGVSLGLGVLMLLLSGVLLTDTALIREHDVIEAVHVMAPPPGEEARLCIMRGMNTMADGPRVVMRPCVKEASQAVEAYIHMKEEAHTGEVEHVNSWQVETHTKDEIELFGVGPNGEVGDELEQDGSEAAENSAQSGDSDGSSEDDGGGTLGVNSSARNVEGAIEEELPPTKRYCVPEMCKRCGEDCKSFSKSTMNQANVLPLRNVHANQTGVLLGTGSSLDKYVHSDYDDEGRAVVTASIKSIIYTSLPVDYVVFSDRAGPKGYDKNFRKIDAYKARKQKFYLHFTSNKNFAPGSNAKWCKRGGALPIEAKAASLGTFPLVSDVGNYQFGSSRSSIFIALQLLLYTGVNKIYVVGCDSSLFSSYATKSGGGKFPGKGKPTEVRKIKEAWAEAVKQVPILYPGVRLIMVNPMGLAGLKGVEKINTGKRLKPLFNPPAGTPPPSPWVQPGTQ